MSDIQNLQKFDPLADAESGSTLSDEGKIHVRIQQRNGRKTLTTVQGLDEKYDKKAIAKFCKKRFCCNGTVIEHSVYGEVIQLQGDQRENILKLLKENGFAKADKIEVHGF